MSVHVTVTVTCDRRGCRARVECTATARAIVEGVPTERAEVEFDPDLPAGWLWTRREGYLCPEDAKR